MGKRSQESKRMNFFSADRSTPKIAPNIAHEDAKPAEVRTEAEIPVTINVEEQSEAPVNEEKKSLPSSEAVETKEKTIVKTKESPSHLDVVKHFDATDLRVRRSGGRNISIYLEEELLDFIDVYTAKTGIKKSALLSSLLRKFMESCEE